MQQLWAIHTAKCFCSLPLVSILAIEYLHNCLCQWICLNKQRFFYLSLVTATHNLVGMLKLL